MPMLDPDRAEHLKNRIAASKNKTELVSAWPRSNKELPAVEVETKWVRFSTLNHRTRAEQDREIKTSGRDDLFTADPLGDEAQAKQYQILCGQEGFAELKADMRGRGQQEPAIITADGILINGNRRAAALRSLFEENYLNAQYIRCLVLPQDTTAEEIVDLEAELQIARDFKQDYSWVNEALLIQELYDREDKNFDRVAKRMHHKVNDVREMYDKIQQVQQLVALSQGTRYLVDFIDHESAFDELAKHIRNKPPKEADDVRAVYFLGTLAGTEYRTLRHLRRSDAADLVRHEIEKDPAMQPVLDAAKTPSPSDSDDHLLDDVLGGPEPEGRLDDLLGFVATKRPEANVTLSDGERVAVNDMLKSLKSAITAAAHEAEEQEKDQSALLAPLQRVERAINELQRAHAQLPKSRAFEEWDERVFMNEIARLEKLVAKLKVVR
jgi:hypothetical protein